MEFRGRRLRFGVQLQAQGTTWPEYLEAVLKLEELGFDSIWTFDHLLPFAGPDDAPVFDALTTLAAMAVSTSRARIGVLIHGVLYRDPATLAKSAALVDHISGGRLEFSLGASWAEREFRAYGLPFAPLSERYARLEEALQVITSLWTQQRSTYRGTYYRLEHAPCEPKPIQRPHPPIMIGGSGRGVLRIAARHATGWNGQGSAEKVARTIDLLRTFCGEIGRDFDEIELSLHPQLAIATRHAAAEEHAAAVAAGHGADLATQRDTWLLGTPDEVTEQLQRYADIGITHWIASLGYPFDMRPLELFCKEVIPVFR